METICPHCQLEVPKGKFICPVCGIDIRDWNPDKLRCPICRSLYPQGTKFCLKDGSPLEQAIVDFDTEATIFLSGSVKPRKKPADDIIPKLKFSDDRDRSIPKTDRDKKDGFTPSPHSPKPLQPEVKAPHPETFSYNPPAEPELEMPEITIDPAPFQDAPKETSPRPAAEASPSPPPRDLFPETHARRKIPSKGLHPKVKPLEEYERLLKKERDSHSSRGSLEGEISELNITESRRPGFFKRLYLAIRVLFGK